MAHCPSIRPLLKEFGLPYYTLRVLLKKYGGFLKGEALGAAFFGLQLDNYRTLDIYLGSSEADPKDFFKKSRLTTDDCLYSSLDDIILDKSGCYTYLDKEHFDYGNLSMVFTYYNKYSDRTVRFNYIHKFASKIYCDPDTCPVKSLIANFWWDDQSKDSIIEHNYNATVLTSIRHSLFHPLEKVENNNIGIPNNRRMFYETFMKHKEKSNSINNEIIDLTGDDTPLYPQAHKQRIQKTASPGYSFWQDIIVSSDDLRCSNIRTELENKFKELGLDFEGTIAKENVDFILTDSATYALNPNYFDKNASFQLTYRFIWNEKIQNDNIVLLKMELQNPEILEEF